MEGVHPPPSEKLWCIHNATGGELPFASSSRCSASRRTNGRSASNVTPRGKETKGMQAIPGRFSIACWVAGMWVKEPFRFVLSN